MAQEYPFPPWKIKMVQSLSLLSRAAREAAIKIAGYNTFLLRSDEVAIDLLSDSGTNAVSSKQYAHAMASDEAVNPRALHLLRQAVKKVYDKDYLLTFHQGRAAERLLFDVLVKKGQSILGNMYFLTTLEFARLRNCKWHDISVNEVYDPESAYPFKGNADLNKVETLIKKLGQKRVAFIRLEANLNIAGGQPFSLSNAAGLRKMADQSGIILVLDATLLSENAYLVWQKERGGSKNVNISDIMKQISRLFDIIYVSSKRDHLSYSGGLLMTNQKRLFERLAAYAELYEGIGLSARDMAMIEQGIYESTDENYLGSRVRQVHYLGKKLIDFGLPVMLPIGGHAVHVDAKRFLPHLTQDKFPAQALAAVLYIESGIRSMEMGFAALGRDSQKGKKDLPKFEMLRLAIPRRVYTEEHLDFVALSLKNLWDKRGSIRGLRMVYEPAVLRSFKARFEPI